MAISQDPPVTVLFPKIPNNFGKGVSYPLIKYSLDSFSSISLSVETSKGALFENFIINEIIKNQMNRNITPKNYFWNAAGAHEIDLLLDHGPELVPVEIKSSRTINSDFFKGLNYFQSISGTLPKNSYLVYGGDENQPRSITNVISWKNLTEIP